MLAVVFGTGSRSKIAAGGGERNETPRPRLHLWLFGLSHSEVTDGQGKGVGQGKRVGPGKAKGSGQGKSKAKGSVREL